MFTLTLRPPNGELLITETVKAGSGVLPMSFPQGWKAFMSNQIQILLKRAKLAMNAPTTDATI